MKTAMLALFILFTCSCGESTGEQFDRFLSELECPVILISKTDKAVPYPSITVRDAAGRVRTFTAGDAINSRGLPSSVSQSRQIGDTLKPCK